MAITDGIALGLENAGAVHHARLYRLLWAALTWRRDMVLAAGDLLVSQRAAGVNMSVDVAVGSACIVNTDSGVDTMGAYFVHNNAVANVTVPAADATNSRIDIIGIRVRDSETAGVSNDAVLVDVSGTPAGSPVDPTLPENFIPLARILIPALDTSIQDAQIGDLRHRWRRRATATRTGGDVNITTTSYANIDTGIDLTIAAKAGDTLRFSVNGRWDATGAMNGHFTVRSVTRAADDVGPVGTSGIPGLFGVASTVTNIAASFLYTVVSGDLSTDGFAEYRVHAKIASAGTKTIAASSTLPFDWNVENLGP